MSDTQYHQALSANRKLVAEIDRLKAENERLRSASFVTAVPSEQYERLRKAGDEMDAYLKRQDGTTNGMLPCRKAWLTAKEGRNAK